MLSCALPGMTEARREAQKGELVRIREFITAAPAAQPRRTKTMFRIDPEEGLGSFTERVLEAAAANVKDLAAENLYIVNQPLARNMAACFGPGQDRMFEEEIANAGKWSGRGICLLADFAKIYGGTFPLLPRRRNR